MIGGAPHIPIRRREVPDGSVTPLDTPFNRKIHEEYAAAMAAGQNAPRPYPVKYTTQEGGHWTEIRFGCVQFSDGSIYDCITKSWRPAKVDPVLRWDEVCAEDPLASNKMVLAGNEMVDEIRKLRAKLLDLEKGTLGGQFQEAIRAQRARDDEGDF